MILWFALFLLIVGISFVLAFRSMKDYQEIPKNFKAEYGLFLIRRPEDFNANVLNAIGQSILEEGLIISIERLFKGKKAALTIFGPKKILDRFAESLNLLELEDYANALDHKDISVWEMGIKGTQDFKFDSPNNIFKNLSELKEEEQFFWQIMLNAGKGKEKSFQAQIRAVIYSKDPERRKILISLLQTAEVGELTKVPKPFSDEQMMVFYKLRSFAKDSSGLILDAEGVIRLLKV